MSRTFITKGIDVFITGRYRYTGSNERFNANDNYKFGNEFDSRIGVQGNIKEELSYIMTTGYRSTSSDQRNDQLIPTTGGKWVYVRPSLNYQILQNTALRISGYYPIYQYLNGIQPTTAFKLTVSLFINLYLKLSGLPAIRQESTDRITTTLLTRVVVS
jgi:hypothetical protein